MLHEQSSGRFTVKYTSSRITCSFRELLKGITYQNTSAVLENVLPFFKN